ncbi:hypothetical protein AXF42_Ash019840 [Apostasia shenzhenica]|uniref:Uncharacterized protein n=1 Tax=Apostasia shenzhenica TaxID=1088818 RepID=A0A2I0ARP2_9ASPA|nr:hypothetical protein AXF42_Ash019840 [Apostasia shenzhenica]
MFLRGRAILLKQQMITVEVSPANCRALAVQFARCEPSSENMENQENRKPAATGDLMSDSYGVGYSTRSNDDGFGGIYGGYEETLKATGDDNEPRSTVGLCQIEHFKHDITQGSEVKQKQNARNEEKASDR